MSLVELLEGKTITTARIDADDPTLIYLHLGPDVSVIALQVYAWGAVETDGKTLQ